jgi:cell division inhibitor SepF
MRLIERMKCSRKEKRKMSNVVNKILNMLNMNVENQDDEEYEDEATEYYTPEQDEENESKSIFGRKTSKNLGASQSVKMVILQPTVADEAYEVCDLLRERKSIIVNLESVNKDIARSIIDIISGAARVLDGNMEKISSAIILVAPYNYDISNDTKEESKSKISVSSWLRNSNN